MRIRIYQILCVILVIAIAFSLLQSFTRVQTAVAIMEKGTIVIDPGHGGEDGGTVSAGKVLEKDLNLAISLELKALFEEGGFHVIMTRSEDRDLGDATLGSITERKRSDMRARAALIAASRASLVLSIHQNHFSQSKYRGAQIFYAKDKQLAETVQKAIVTELQPDNKRLAKKIDTVFLLNEAEIPAVVVECGFLSNAAETELLQQSTYQKEMALAIFHGAEQYLSSL